MKELSIEEKAKRYDEVIEIAREWSETKNGYYMPKELCEEIFPELKESEDEKIRESLLEYLHTLPNHYAHSGVCAPECIAWLKKQGESYTKRDVDDAYLKGVTNAKNEIKKQYEANYQIRKDIATFILNYKGDIKDRAKWIDYLGIKVYFAEKKSEQKPVTVDIDIDKMVDDYANNKERGNEEFGKPVNCMIRAYRQGLIDIIEKVEQKALIKAFRMH